MRRCALGDPAQLRADQEGVDPAGRGAEMRVVQDHPPQAPVVGIAVPVDPLVIDVEVGGLGRAEEGRDLRAQRALVEAAGVAGGRRAGDPPRQE